MAKNHDTVAALRQTNRGYMKANREDWAELGFRNFTCLVHDDEREEVLAELEVRKCAALVAMAENARTPEPRLRILARRNMNKLPSSGDLSELTIMAQATKEAAQIEAVIDIARNYAKRYRGIEGQFDKATDDKKRMVMSAKAVAYSAASAAHARLARAMITAAPMRDTSIFGMKGEEE